MRVIAVFLIISLSLPTFAGSAYSQLLLNPVKILNADPVVKSEASSQGISAGFISEYVSDNYILGPGDNIEVHLIVGDNALAVDYNFLISPDGKLFFPNIGEIDLNALSLKQAKIRLIQMISKTYKEEFKLSLLLRQPKQVKIYLTGLVAKTGPLAIWDGSHVSEVIKQAGGILPGGSNRTILIQRGDKALTADLYLAMGKGDTAKDIRIAAGDIVEIPPAGSVRVTVMGEVPRPGQYELKEGEKLKDLLAMVGYTGVNSALSKVAYLKRESGKEKFENYHLNLYDLLLKNDESRNVILSDGDILSVPSIQSQIYVYGEVGNPGRIDYVPGKKLSDYINFAGGPTVKANLAGTTVTRQENEKPAEYRINASEILRKGNLKNDLELMGGDVVFVPGNFFYFSDFASFTNTLLLAFSLYSTLKK